MCGSKKRCPLIPFVALPGPFVGLLWSGLKFEHPTRNRKFQGRITILKGGWGGVNHVQPFSTIFPTKSGVWFQHALGVNGCGLAACTALSLGLHSKGEQAVFLWREHIILLGLANKNAKLRYGMRIPAQTWGTSTWVHDNTCMQQCWIIAAPKKIEN